MLHFEIKTKEDFVNTLNAGGHVVIGTRDNGILVPFISAYMMLMKNEEEIKILYVFKNEDNQKLFSDAQFDRNALTGTIPKGTHISTLDYSDENLDEYYTILTTSDNAYLFTTYSNPLMD